jgi:hypothetical protein
MMLRNFDNEENGMLLDLLNKSNINIIIAHDHIDEDEIVNTSVAPQKLDSSAMMFTSPRKKDMKNRRRKIDYDRQEERRIKALKKEHNKIQSVKDINRIEPYGILSDDLIYR